MKLIFSLRFALVMMIVIIINYPSRAQIIDKKTSYSVNKRHLKNHKYLQMNIPTSDAELNKILLSETAIISKPMDDIHLQLSNQPSNRQIGSTASMNASGAMLRVIDKIYGTSGEITVFKDLRLQHHSLTLELYECSYDSKDLKNEALALLKISDNGAIVKKFDGWMSSRYSHLTNYNNYRYSVWLLSCIISNQE